MAFLVLRGFAGGDAAAVDYVECRSILPRRGDKNRPSGRIPSEIRKVVGSSGPFDRVIVLLGACMWYEICEEGGQ